MTALLAFAGAIYTAVAVGVYLAPDVRPFPDRFERVAWALFSLLWPVGLALFVVATIAGMLLPTNHGSRKL